MSLKTIIIDDEENAIRLLKSKLQGMDVTVINHASSVEEGLKLIADADFDLLFLDIQMQDGTGFDLLEKLDQIDFEVVFITAHDAYAIDAFKVNAIDYLLKPVTKDELQKAVQRVAKRQNSNDFVRLSELLNKRDTSRSKIAIRERSRIVFVLKEEILFCKAEGTYTTIYCLDTTQHLSSLNLGYFEEILTTESNQFLRVHRSFVINLHHVKEYNIQDQSVILTNGQEVPVSSKLKDQLINSLQR